MAKDRRKSRFLKETSQRSGFDNWDFDRSTFHKRWEGIKDKGILISPEEYDEPPLSKKSLGGADITRSNQRPNGDTIGVTSSQLLTVQYLTGQNSISPISSQPWVQIVGSNQTVVYTGDIPPLGQLSVGSGNSVSSLTLAHATSGSNRLLVVGVSTEDSSASDVINDVAYAGTSMTRAMGNRRSNDRYDLWYLFNPTVGSNDVVVTFTGVVSSVITTARTYFDIIQRSSPYLIATASGNNLITISTSLNLTSADTVEVDGIVFSSNASFVVAGNEQKVVLSRQTNPSAASPHRQVISHAYFANTGTPNFTWDSLNNDDWATVWGFAAFEKNVINPISSGTQDQQLAIECVGSSVTLNHGANLVLANSQMYTMNSGDILNVVYSQTDSLWHETSRSKQ